MLSYIVMLNLKTYPKTCSLQNFSITKIARNGFFCNSFLKIKKVHYSQFKNTHKNLFVKCE